MLRVDGRIESGPMWMNLNRSEICGGLLLLVMTISALPTRTAAQTDAALAGPGPRPVVLSLEPYAGSSLKTVGVTVGDKTIPFLLDTGGGITVVTPEVVDALGCEPFGQMTGFRADGTEIRARRCGPTELRIGAYRAAGEVGVFDLMGMIRDQVEQARARGQEVAMPPTVGGLIGLASFEQQTLTLDYAHDQLIVETPHSAGARTRSMRPIGVRVSTGASGSVEVFLEARAQTGTLWLQLDSGNDGPTFLAPHAVKQLGIVLPPGERDSLNIDLIGLGELPITVMRRPMIYDGQLGLGAIRKLLLTIDLADGRAWASFSD